ncbi:NADH dehydrogenase subunit N [Desulfonispora thiosulfatigenes DSM 11270]|uniref:NADH-quinone oxidoreductase subunit N n=1 Tax=Desulfonispora thiosulfatigenes DSM 11270 TaxID=656914 RepID=A0A1W1VL23_DESTI|nr:NADH-quinone oxidoreductase subunit N [Desulfonispora thiosulfatigenes]SMB93920.1 NADH dehydrogenase subunit N [Desulfonispora thiosulfatigenes DSM 11270]
MDINFSLILPELLIAGLAFLIMIISLLVPKDQKKGLGYLSVFGLLVITFILYKMIGVDDSVFNGMLIIDPFGTYFKILIVLSSALTILLGTEYITKFVNENYGEFCFLTLFATLGMMILVSAGDFITLYVALELMTLAFIILVGFGKNIFRSSEAGIKYLLLSALSSAILLYGLTLVYGVTKTTFIHNIVHYALSEGISNPAVLLGMVFILTGFLFKVSAVPFHMWTPDVYEGAPTPITALLSVASKGAAFGVFIRVFLHGFTIHAPLWMPIIITIAVITILLGNFVAIPQTNIKRLLAFSGVAQAGYILLGLVAYSTFGVASILFYTMMYVFSNMGAFGVILAFSQAGGGDEISDYNGMWKRSPFLAAVMLMSLLSLAGIPPLIGFVGKFKLFTAIIAAGYMWLAFLAIGMSMVSVYYYLLVAKAMYLNDPKPENDTKIKVPFGMQASLFIIMILTLVLGVYPTPLTNLAIKVAQTFF